MYPNALIGNFVHLYGIMIAVGIVAAFIVLFLYSKKFKIQGSFTDFVFYNGIVSIVFGFGSAAVFQAFYNWIENPEKGFNLGSGITFIGGLIGGVICFLVVYLLCRKRYKSKLVDVLSIVPCAILIAHGFGRIGCFFAGCCYGAPAKGALAFLGVSFAPGSLAYYDCGSTPLHPTMLYEAIFLFILFAVCTFLLFKFKFKHNMSIYLIFYGIFRFLIEYLRDDHRGELVSGISPSQFWSILMVVAGIALWVLLEMRWKKHPRTPYEEINEPQVKEETKEEAKEE